MQVNSVNTGVNAIPPVPQGNANKTAKQEKESKTAASTAKTDVYEPSGQTAKTPAKAQGNSKSYSADVGKMRDIWLEHDRHVESFRKLIASLINKQADRSQAAGIPWNFNDPNAMVEIDDEARAAARDAIGEGGPFSVEAVATRLLDFAVAISGGDPAKIDLLRNAVEKGFAAAERQWGGELPEISQKTREAVMNGFDQWKQSGDASSISLLNKNTSPAATV